jgi:hypothetical protein
MDRPGFASLLALDLPALNAKQACASQGRHTGSAHTGGALARRQLSRRRASCCGEASGHAFFASGLSAFCAMRRTRWSLD